MHRLLAAEHAVRGAVDAQAAELDHAVAVVAVRAAHDRADARDQLARRERLDHVVVDAGFEAADAIDFLAARGEHDDRNLARELFLAQAAREIQAAHARQHPVEQDQVGHALGDHALRGARIGRVHRVHAGLAQGEGDHVADRGFVFDDQDVFLHEGHRSERRQGAFMTSLLQPCFVTAE